MNFKLISKHSILSIHAHILVYGQLMKLLPKLIQRLWIMRVRLGTLGVSFCPRLTRQLSQGLWEWSQLLSSDTSYDQKLIRCSYACLFLRIACVFGSCACTCEAGVSLDHALVLAKRIRRIMRLSSLIRRLPSLVHY